MQKLLSMPFYRRLLLLAVLLHLCAAWFSEGYYGDDEQGDMYNFIALKTGDIPTENGIYEYLDAIRNDAQPNIGWTIRSAVQPFIGYAIWQVVPDGINTPFITAFLMRLLSVILAFWAALAFFLAYQNDIKNESARRWVLSAMLLCWVLLFYHARFSSEGWMVSFLLLALASLRREQFFAAGLLFGAAFVVRYQTGLILLSMAAYVLFILRPGVRNIALAVAGGCSVLVAEFFINWLWFYEKPFLPAYDYFLYTTTIVKGAINPPREFYEYFLKSGALMPFIGYFLPFILAVFWWKFPRHVLTWATLLYTLFHLYSDFKTWRYMYPMLAFMPFITALVWESVIQQKEKLKRGFLWLLKISAVINAPLLLFAAFYPATAEVKMLRQCILPTMHEENISTVYYFYEKGESHNINLPFYFRRVSVVPVDDESELAEKARAGEAALYVSRKPRDKQLQESGLEYERVCSALPEWVLRFNFNNWTARASSYPVYRVVKS